MMLRTSLKGKYDTDKVGAVGIIAVHAVDVKLRATKTNATFVDGPSLNGLIVTLEKTDSFIFDYNIPKKGVRVVFMNSVKVLHKLLNLTYNHGWANNRTALGGMMMLDSSNKLSANYGFDSGNGKVKYNYVPGGASTFEPSNDFSKNSWYFSFSQRVYADVVKATYHTSRRVLRLEWSRSSKFNGAFKDMQKKLKNRIEIEEPQTSKVAPLSSAERAAMAKTLPGPLSVRVVAAFKALEGKDLTAQVSAETDAVSLLSILRLAVASVGQLDGAIIPIDMKSLKLSVDTGINQPANVVIPSLFPSPAVHLYHGFVNPAASILPTIAPRLAQTSEIMASTTIK